MEEIKILYIKYYTKIQYQLVQKYNPIYIYNSTNFKFRIDSFLAFQPKDGIS